MGNVEIKPYAFSSFEQFLWHEAEQMVDERLKGNRRKGAIFEAFIYLIFDYIVDSLNLKNKIRILHNPFSFRKYVSREGRGIDILVQYKKWTGNWLSLFYIECKNWTKRFMSPAVFKSHVLQRFFNIVKPIKILITKGIEFSTYTRNQIKNHSFIQITNNYVNQIKQLITNKLKITNNNVNNTSLSVPIHKTQKNNITIPSQTEKFCILTLLTSCLIIQNRMKCDRKLVGG